MSTVLINKVRSGLEGRNVVISDLYLDKSMQKAVVGTLIKMGCPKAEALDFFSDAIVNFIKSCYKNEFEIKSSLTNYLIGTAKYLWFNQLSKEKRKKLVIEPNLDIDSNTPEIVLINEERKGPLLLLLSKLDATCRQVLTLWSMKKKMEEIAMTLQYKSQGMARKKKHQCLQRMYAIIEANPNLKDDLRSML